MAQEDRMATVDFSGDQTLTVTEDQVTENVGYSFTDAQGVTFTLVAKDWVESTLLGTKDVRLYQFPTDAEKGTVFNSTFAWTAPEGYVIQVKSITINTRVYCYGATCSIGSVATTSSTAVNNVGGGNTSVTSSVSYPEGNGSTYFSYQLTGRRGTTTHAGSIYVRGISVNYKLYHRTAVLDEEVNETFTAGLYKDVTVKRAMASDKYNALCLPFDYAPTGWEIYEMSSQKVDNGNVTFVFNEASSITAGVPCIVKTNADIAEIVVNNVTLVNEPSTVNPGYADFKGTFVPTTLAQGDIYLSNSNAFKELSAASANMKGFRSYITNVNAASNSSFGIQFGDTVTAIQTVNGDILANDAPIYNIKGQRVSFPTEAGVYVQNGRKFIIK